jgi:LPS export ABC transporter protein LptC
MKNDLRIRLLLPVAVLVAIILAVILLRRPDAPRISPSRPPASAPVAVMEGMRATEFRLGVKRWDLSAEQAEYARVPERTLLTGVTLTVMGKPAIGTVTFTARRAEFMNTTKDLLLPDGVAATGDRQLHFTAGPALFRNASSLLTARGHVRYVDEMLQVEGEEMEFASDTRNLRLRRNIRATIQPQAAKR